MAYVITEPCVGVKDGACVSVCPVDCIHPTPGSTTGIHLDQLFIDPDTCICCGACVEVCPVAAIFDECDVPAKWMHYIEKNAANFRK